MPIKYIQPGQAGVSNNTPSWVYIETNDTYQTVTAAGYLNGAAHEYINTFKNNMMVVISTKTAPGIGTLPILYMLQLRNLNGVWSLIAPGASNNTVNNANITLSSSQVLAAYATPQLLLPAPGAGLTTLLLSAQIVTEVGTSAFASGGNGIVQYGATVHGGGTNALSATIPSAEITAASSQIYSMLGYAATTVTTGITNAAIYFSNATGSFTTGVGSSLNINLQYVTFSATV